MTTSLSKWIAPVLVLPLAVVIVFGLWAAGAAAFENIRFAQATDQVLGIVGTARDFAARTPSFATQAGEDALAELNHAGIIAAVDAPDGQQKKIINPWHGDVFASVTESSFIRIETSEPTRDCRRMALFLVKDARDLQLEVMEVRGSDEKGWRQFYNGKNDTLLPASWAVEAACGNASMATLALVFRLR